MTEDKRGNILCIVVPCYNEEEVIEKSIFVLKEKLLWLIERGKVSNRSKIMFVDDGSHDRTLPILYSASQKDKMISVLKLSTNFGHQSAILAGMMYAKEYADMVITIDADLQQDINAIDCFIESYEKGCEIVYGVRNDRDTDTFLKKTTAVGYYKLLKWLGCNIITNHADYRLMSTKVLKVLDNYKEVNLFMRGLVPTMGFQSDIVYIDVKDREAGKSKYTLKKMLSLAIDGVTSFSVRPLRIIAVLGLLTCLFGVGMLIFTFIEWINHNTLPGYATTLMAPLIMEGVTLLSLGIIGEYIGKIYMETKGRPRYIVDTFIWKEDI